MFDLTGKKFLLTGATGGIGQAIIKILREAGATLCITGTRLEILKTISKEEIPFIQCDLSNDEEIEQLVPKAQEIMQGFDGIICNAGITIDKLILRMNNDDLLKVLNINLISTFKLNRSACKALIKNGWGRIINISSIIGITGNAGQANYAAAKAGIIAMSKSIAQEFAAKNITVNCIAPGFIDTPMTSVLKDEIKSKILNNIPMRRMGLSKEVAAGVLFLASKESSYITGTTLHINGGLFM